VSENIDLGAMISDNPLLGTGFGVPINYTVAPLADLTAVDSMIAYVPHNGVLYVWMRMGLPGEVMLWLLVAAAIAAGTRASRSTDPQVQVLGALVACTTVGWLIMGYTDMGFWWFRLALAFGCLLGLLEAAVVRAEREQTTLPVAAP
jgi:O-antigen ligase